MEYSKRAILIESFAEANIPPIYWFLKIAEFTGPDALKTILEEYRDDIEPLYQKGQMLVMLGNYGTGKTTACCHILKMSLMRGHGSYYTTLADLISYMTDYNTQKEFWNLISRIDLLCIDEVDDRHFSKSEEAQKLFGSTFERIIRYRVQNGMPTILASNNSSLDEIFTGQYKRVVDSLMGSAKTVTCLGPDNRKKK